MITFRVGLVATLLMALVICAGTLIPSAAPLTPPGSNKLHHIVAFAFFAMPMILVSPKYWRQMITYSLLLGVAIELIQPHVNRTGDPADLLADGVGAVIGILVGLASFRVNQIRRGRYEPIYIDRNICSYSNRKR